MVLTKKFLTRFFSCVLTAILVVSFNPYLYSGSTDAAFADEEGGEGSTTQEKLDAAQAELDKVNGELEELQAENETLQDELAYTVKRIDEEQQNLEEKQDQLGKLTASKYRDKGTGVLEIVLSSTSFDELANNWFYANKVIQNEANLISDVKQTKADLEELQTQQQAQIESVKNKTNEVTELINSLSEDVKQLMEQRDAELAAAAAAAAAAAEAAANQSAAAASGSSGGYASGARPSVATSEKGQAIINACYTTPSPGLGWCAAWVSNVYANAGLGHISGNACDMYWAYCHSSDRSELEPGMIIADPSHTGTGSAGEIYGHVGIYLGDGLVISNVGAIYTQSLDSFISFYGNRYPVKWGWA